jgi:hypothetical protein
MKYTIRLLLIVAVLHFIGGCKDKKKQVPLSADFKLGKINVINTRKVVENGEELTLMTRFELGNKKINAELSNYFQYQLGKKIKLIIEGDTLNPVLFYYLPLINEAQKEIDVKFLINGPAIYKEKRMIIQDSILDFNKVNISFK